MTTRSQKSRLGFVLATSLCAGACVQGELENVGVEFDNLVDRTYEFESGDRILVGARLCPEFVWWSGPTGQGEYIEDQDRRADLRACYDETLEGAEFDDGCLQLDAVGEVSWKLDADPGCSIGAVESDLFRFAVIEPSDQLQLGFNDWQARAFAGNPVWGEMLDPIGIEPGGTTTDLISVPHQPRYVIAGGTAVLSLRLDDPQGQVFWAAGEDSLELVGDGLSRESDEDEHPGQLAVRVSEDAVGVVRAELGDDVQLESPSVIGVALDQAQRLDLIAVANEAGQPVAARAVVRDEQGRILHGAPIDWKVTQGALGVTPGRLSNQAKTQDYALLEVACETPPTVPTQRTAELRAELGSLRDSVTLEWTAEPGNAVGFEPHGSCVFAEDDGDVEEPDDDADEQEDGCQCSAEGGGAAGLLGVLGIFGLLTLRRRRVC